MTRRKLPRIWTMEGSWSTSVRDVRSVQPVLRAIEDAGHASTARQVLNTPTDLITSMGRWGQKQHSAYTIGYLALHGQPGAVAVGRRTVRLTDLGRQLRDNNVRLSGRVLHFGSCAVLQDEAASREFRGITGLKAVTGFTEDVDWMESLAFELLLLDTLAYYQRIDAAERYITSNYGELAERLGFRMLRAQPRRSRG